MSAKKTKRRYENRNIVNPMEMYLLEWTQLLLRWLHVIVAIAWIGSSFYFVFLDSNLIPPQDPALQSKGVGGEMWAVHGGITDCP